MVGAFWARVRCSGTVHAVALVPFGRLHAPCHTLEELRASRALALLGGEPLG